MVHERHPMVRSVAPAIEAINQSVENLLAVGYDVPTWESLMTNTNVPVADVEEPNQLRVGWQAAASRAVETSFMRRLLPTLSYSEAALFRSQGGPLASAPFVSFPWDRTCRLEPQPLRVLLLRRLRLPLTFTTRTIGQRVLLW